MLRSLGPFNPKPLNPQSLKAQTHEPQTPEPETPSPEALDLKARSLNLQSPKLLYLWPKRIPQDLPCFGYMHIETMIQSFKKAGLFGCR